MRAYLFGATAFGTILASLGFGTCAIAQTLAVIPFDPTGRNAIGVFIPNTAPFAVTVIKTKGNGSQTALYSADILVLNGATVYKIGAGQSQCKIIFPVYGMSRMSFLARSNAVITTIKVNFGAGSTTPLCSS